MTPPRVVLAGIVTAMVFAAVAVALNLPIPAKGGAHEIELKGVDGDDIAGWMRMLKPDDRSPSVSSDEAVTLAAANKPGATVLETVLMRLVNGSVEPRLDRLAWAVNFDPATVQAVPPGGPAGAKFPPVCNLHPEYDVVWIDAQTGEFIYETQYTAKFPGADDPAATCPPKDYPSPTAVP